MHSAVHIARRGLQAVATYSQDSDGPEIQVSGLAVLVLLLTCLFFLAIIFTVSYVFGQVVPTLCMIESPETAAYVPVNSMNPDDPPAYNEDDGAPTTDNEVLLTRSKPFTSSIRQTVQHLRARGGFWSPFRGLGLFLILGLARNFLVGFLSFASNNPIMLALATVIAETLLANVHMTWIHIVISEPNPKRWWHRIPKPAFKTWQKIAPATILWSITTQVVYVLPVLIMGANRGRMADPDYHPGKKEIYLTMGQMFGAVIVTLTLFFLLEIPAMVTLVRVAASMLPEEDETIVPFDRTYGGKVTPAIVGGDGKIDLKEAWKSFPWASRKRLVILCAKIFGILFGIYMLFSIVVVLEAHLIFGTEGFGQLMKTIHEITHGRQA